MERLRVRRAETDAQRIVFNGHYLLYFDTALAGYWRALMLPYEETLRHFGGDVFLRKATLDYRSPARCDDLLDIGVRCGRVGKSSMQFAAAVFRQEQLLASGELVYVFAETGLAASRPVPPQLRETLHVFEQGEAMLQLRLGTWADLGRDAQAVRTAVFIEEQKIPVEMEWDAADASCVHAVAYNRLGMPLATGRLLSHAPGVAKIGRMAVLRTMRGGRVGRRVLDALMQQARARGEREVVLHAQLSATPFYARAGFRETGAPFEEAGIAHIEMACTL